MFCLRSTLSENTPRTAFDSPTSGKSRRQDNDDGNDDSRLLISGEGSARHDAPLQILHSQLRLQELAKSGVPVPLPKRNQTMQPKIRMAIDEFVIRQENMEKHRLAKLVRKKLELEYEAKDEKRKCPSCKKIQSFDEYIEEKDVCQCGFKFESPSSFHLRRFERRIFQSQQSFEKKAALAANAEDFLKRMQVDLLKRK